LEKLYLKNYDLKDPIQAEKIKLLNDSNIKALDYGLKRRVPAFLLSPFP
jgi:hypothetical protein